MWEAIEQAVQHCDCEMFALPLAMDQQAVQHCFIRQHGASKWNRFAFGGPM